MPTNGVEFAPRSLKDIQMSHEIVIRPRARLDVVELATHIAKDSALAASRFLDASAATFGLLAKSPGIGGVYRTKNDRLRGIRVFRVTGFPNHLAFYLERKHIIEIVRVIHGARDLDAALQDES